NHVRILILLKKMISQIIPTTENSGSNTSILQTPSQNQLPPTQTPQQP
ncbi:4251_t:CDS:1, partial [Cetraspora pellucida]